MKIALLGATGPLGLCVLSKALDAGDEVVAMVRNLDKISFIHDNLKVVKADLFDSSQLAAHIEGVDVVISCMGSPISWSTPITTCQNFAVSIVNAMKEKDISRLIFCSAMYTRDGPHPFFVRFLLKPLLIGRNLDDLAVAEEFFTSDECKDINYTVVKPPGLSNGPLDDVSTWSTRVGDGGVEGYHQIPRANVAQFMLHCARTGEFANSQVSFTLKSP